MALYSYTKSRSSPLMKISTLISTLFIFSGVGLFGLVVYPIASFELFYAPKLTDLTKPVPDETRKISFMGSLTQVLGMENTDFTRASVWFPKAINLQVPFSSSNINSYTLDIPKLKIEKATVLVGGDDLSKSLIHFTGSLPGKLGNSVIFGHSTLLWFYNPNDYKSIFSKLPDLELGDEILTTVDGITYTYKVIDMKVVYPNDLSALMQTEDDYYISLVTCVPPGTYLKRLVVKGKLESI